MDYVVGFVVAILGVWFINNFTNDKNKEVMNFKINYSQSYIFELIKDSLPLTPIPTKMTQLLKYEQQQQTRIMVYYNDAYWIEDNSVYSAKIIDGEIDENSKKIVDMYAIDDVELKKMNFIVEKLTEGLADEDRNSRN